MWVPGRLIITSHRSAAFLEVVVHESMEYVSDALDSSVSQMAGPAEVRSGSLGCQVWYAVTQLVWGWFLLTSVRLSLHLYRPWVLERGAIFGAEWTRTVPYRRRRLSRCPCLRDAHRSRGAGPYQSRNCRR